MHTHTNALWHWESDSRAAGARELKVVRRHGEACVFLTKEPPNCLGFINAAAFQLQPKLLGVGKKKEILVGGRKVYLHCL